MFARAGLASGRREAAAASRLYRGLGAISQGHCPQPAGDSATVDFRFARFCLRRSQRLEGNTDSTLLFLWRMPTRAQMEKMAAAVGRKASPVRGLAPDDDLPPEYWQALLDDAGADQGRSGPSAPRRPQRPSQIPQHVLRVACRRCSRTIDIQRSDAVRLYGPDAVWKDVSQRLLDNTCTRRTGRHEEDGCWPSYD